MAFTGVYCSGQQPELLLQKLAGHDHALDLAVIATCTRFPAPSLAITRETCAAEQRIRPPRVGRLPAVTMRPAGDPEYFPVGVKHRYTRSKQEATSGGGS
jgi:hypothetical protein